MKRKLMRKLSKLSLVTLLLLLLLGAQTATEGLFVTITRLDSQQFPQIVAHMTAIDSNGLPVNGLTTTELSITEDGMPVSPEVVTIEGDNSANLRLVIALDVSMPAAEVETMKAATIAFINSLRPKDQLQLIEFYDEMRVLQDFTEDKARLVAAVEQLQPAGDFTILHETVYTAATNAGQFPVGRRAVILVTNSGNNVESPYTAAETIAHARSLKVPLYIVGMQTLNRLADFQNVAQQTGGQSYLLNSVAELETTLSEIETLLRPGYRISYPSNLMADNQEHTVQLTVQRAGQQGSDEATFVTVLGEIAIDLVGVVDGQTVTGLVTLMSQVTAPVEQVTVEYFLAEESLGTATEPPYSVEWNSNQSPTGEYPLRATAVDQAGNEGQTEPLSVRVPDSIAVIVFAPDNAQIGDAVVVEAQVASLSEVAQVEFFIDDQAVGTVTEAPYRITVDSADYQAGQHAVSAQATDVLGAMGQANLDLQLIAVPTVEDLSWWERFLQMIGAPYSIWWLLWLACMTMLFLLLLLPFLLILFRSQRGRGNRRLVLEVTNLGNIRSRYELRAQEEEEILSFEFQQNNSRLLERRTQKGRTGTTPIFIATGAAAGTAAAGGGQGGAVPMQAQGGTQNQATGAQASAPMPQGQVLEQPQAAAASGGGSGGGNFGGFSNPLSGGNNKQKLAQAGALAKMAGPVGEILYSISYVLPTVAANPLRSLANTLRRANMAARRIETSSKKLEQYQGEGQQMAEQAGISGGGSAPQGGRSAPARPAAPGQAAGPPRAGQPQAAASGGGGFRNPISGTNKQKLAQAGALAKMAGPAGDILYSISYVLPTVVANPLRNLANTLRRANMAAQRIETSSKKLEQYQGEGQQMAEQAGFAGGDGGQQPSQQRPSAPQGRPAAFPAGGGGQGQQQPMPAPVPGARPVPASQAPTAMPATAAAVGGGAATASVSALAQQQAEEPAGPNSLARNGVVQHWAETAFINPGETTNVDLVVKPSNPYRTRTYHFTISSRSVEEDEAPVVSEDGELEVRSIFGFRYIILPTLLFIGMIIFGMGLFTALLTGLGIVELTV